MDKYIGKILDDRYEILELIGVGGMAVVYKAKCHTLNRFVAIKIMREELAQDQEFRQRFHEESLAVASLSHPNIVQVFDVSKGDLEYIVMELIDGITLKEYMEKRGPLTWKEVTFFGIQIAKALEHAHGQGIIHRDIKPHNIMLLRDGTLKVTDFGIAHHAAQHTNHVSEAIGSVHYVSPEQARGSAIDCRSDLYSFGVVLYEMLTGRLPFEGETPLSVAMQHIKSVPLLPSDYVEGIPQALEAITMKAMCANLQYRYSSATEILNDLEEFSKNPNMTLPMDHVLTAAEPELHRTGEIRLKKGSDAKEATRKLDSQELEDAVHKFESKPENREEDKTENAGRHSIGKRLLQRNSKSQKPTEEKQHKPGWKERRRAAQAEKYSSQGVKVSLFFSTVCVGVFLLGAFLFVYGIIDPFGQQKTESITVPKLVGLDYDEMLANTTYYDGFEIYLSQTSYNDTVPEGQIIYQSPSAGRSGQKGDVISVTVSLGAKSAKLENYVGMSYRTVSVKLGRQGLHTVKEEVYDEKVEAGIVIKTEPAAGTPVQDGAEIRLIVSKGPEPRYTIVPDVKGWDVAKATKELEGAKLVVAPLQYEESTYPEGTVLFQSLPMDSSVVEYSEIILTVSKQAKPTVTMPCTFALSNVPGEIQVTVSVDGTIQYSGTHTAQESVVSVTLTAEQGYRQVVITQNGVVTETYFLNFAD